MLKEFFTGVNFTYKVSSTIDEAKEKIKKLFEKEEKNEFFDGKITDNKISFNFKVGRQKAFGIKGLGFISEKGNETFLKTKIFCGAGPRVMASIWILAITHMFVGSILRASKDGSWYFPVGILLLYGYGYHLLKQWFEPLKRSQKQFEEEVRKAL